MPSQSGIDVRVTPQAKTQVVHGPKVSSVPTLQTPMGEMWEMLPGPACEQDKKIGGHGEAMLRWQLWLCIWWGDDLTYFQYLEDGWI